METQSKVLKWSLIIGIVVVLNLFFNYSLSLIYKQPDFEAFCPNSQVVTAPDNQKECVAEGGQWNQNNYPKGVAPVGESQPAGYCNLYYTCQMNFDAANKVYDRNVFVTLVLLGALCVAAGSFIKGNSVIGYALSLGGVLSFVIASMRYWSSANNLIKVVILLIALLILGFVAMKKFKDKV